MTYLKRTRERLNDDRGTITMCPDTGQHIGHDLAWRGQECQAGGPCASNILLLDPKL